MILGLRMRWDPKVVKFRFWREKNQRFKGIGMRENVWLQIWVCFVEG